MPNYRGFCFLYWFLYDKMLVLRVCAPLQLPSVLNPLLSGALGSGAQAAKGARAWEKAEDPIWALENNLPIDAQHYLDHHLSQPLLRIFGPIMKNANSLLVGELPANAISLHGFKARHSAACTALPLAIIAGYSRFCRAFYLISIYVQTLKDCQSAWC